MSELAKREEEILAFWNKEGIFKKSLEKAAPKGEYIFYDGPPFASGLPHYGHILAGTVKDAIPRFYTMRGYYVPRRWGWDCHGLPVENLVEKELGLKSKRDIEAFGIEKFNEAARAHIMKDDAEWRRIIPRTGRFADMERNYKTMDTSYTESVWWAFKKLFDKGLIYEGFKSLHYCPHCGTTLSNFEVAQGYKDIDDVAVTVKLPLAEEPDTALLVWTTTPWTLPGNAAAAVNPAFTYTKVKTDKGFVIVAEGKVEGEVVKRYKGSELVGKKYRPPFVYFRSEATVYPAEFVTAEDGTGIVHIAPAFGADDLALAQANKVPLIHHVDGEGKFVEAVAEFAGKLVKPKGNPRETDEEIAAYLEEKGLLFKKEKINHAYPHCWRCDTPLLNWAANSWFVRVSSLKSKLINQNSKIHWVPEHVGKGRFANGLESAPDWAISRSRYWGAPLPVWRNEKTREVRVAGSVNDMLALVRRSGNRYFVMRHGEAELNVQGVLDGNDEQKYPLTEKGKNQVLHTAAELKREKIDLVIASPFKRTLDTAKLVHKELGLPDSALMTDERIRDIGFGEFNNRPHKEWKAFYKNFAERFVKAPEGGETYTELRTRLGEFLFEVERRYSNKNVLIVMHEGPAYQLHAIASRYSIARTIERKSDDDFLDTGEARELPFTPYPHNKNYELDLHRPYIDELPMGNSVTGEWRRITDVFDCWFESGSMPYASNHYPFDYAQGKPSKERFNPGRWFGLAPKGYPADFIAEGLDQTRGWFYSLIVLGTALFGRAPYKNVVVNGLVLASDGQKMSKRLKNYPDPMDVVEKYGADSLRYYLLASPVVRGEDLRFNERGVDEVSKKILMRLDNVRSFYDLVALQELPLKKSSGLLSEPSTAAGLGRPDFSLGTPAAHPLDRWILSRLGELVAITTQGYEKYELDVATRPLGEFVEDLSNWYVRRSRERFKEGSEGGLRTLHYTLTTVAKIMAPAMPFFADDLYRRMRNSNDPESVHLAEWPTAGAADVALLAGMKKVRELASKGLELRERAGVKLRQPLASITLDTELPPELLDIVRDELNVKEVKVGTELALDTVLTDELKEEGVLRDVIRAIQEERKNRGLTVSERVRFMPELAAEEEAVAKKHRSKILEITNVELDVSENNN